MVDFIDSKCASWRGGACTTLHEDTSLAEATRHMQEFALTTKVKLVAKVFPNQTRGLDCEIYHTLKIEVYDKQLAVPLLVHTLEWNGSTFEVPENHCLFLFSKLPPS